jgi:hypothetical protein
MEANKSPSVNAAAAEYPENDLQRTTMYMMSE